MKWILDDMVLGDMACVVPPNDLSTWPGNEMVIADATARAAAQDGSGRRQAMLAARSGITGTAIISSFVVTVGSKAGNILYTHLRTRTRGTANLAEHESIAWALADPSEDAVLVSRDKHAVTLALAELGRGHVCHPYELFAYLHSQGYLAQQQFEDLKNRTGKKDPSIPIPWRLSPQHR
ncbi:MAG: hypothetical protein V2B18_01780 [Pseudomonadota bacterium]